MVVLIMSEEFKVMEEQLFEYSCLIHLIIKKLRELEMSEGMDIPLIYEIERKNDLIWEM